MTNQEIKNIEIEVRRCNRHNAKMFFNETSGSIFPNKHPFVVCESDIPVRVFVDGIERESGQFHVDPKNIIYVTGVTLDDIIEVAVSEQTYNNESVRDIAQTYAFQLLNEAADIAFDYIIHNKDAKEARKVQRSILSLIKK